MKRYRKVTWLSGSSGITHCFHQALSAAPLLQVMAIQSGGNLQERGGGRTCGPIRGLLGIPEAPVNQSWSAPSAVRGLNQRGVGWRRGRRRDPGADGASRRESCSTWFLSSRHLHLHKKTWCLYVHISGTVSPLPLFLIYDVGDSVGGPCICYVIITWCCGRPVRCWGISSWLFCFRRHSKWKAGLWEAVWKNAHIYRFMFIIMEECCEKSFLELYKCKSLTFRLNANADGIFLQEPYLDYCAHRNMNLKRFSLIYLFCISKHYDLSI